MTKLEALAKSRPSFTTMQISQFFGDTTAQDRSELYDKLVKKPEKEDRKYGPYYSYIMPTLKRGVMDFQDDRDGRADLCFVKMSELEITLSEMEAAKAHRLTLARLQNNISALDKFHSCQGPDVEVGEVEKGGCSTYRHSGEFFDVTFTPDLLFKTKKGKRGALKFRIKKEEPQEAQVDFIMAMMMRYLAAFCPNDKIDHTQCVLFDLYADRRYCAGKGAYVNTWKCFDKTSKEIWPQLLKRYEAQEAKAA